MQLHLGQGLPPGIADRSGLWARTGPAGGTVGDSQAPRGSLPEALWGYSWDLPQLPAQDTAQGGCGSLHLKTEEHSPGKKGAGAGRNSEDGQREDLGTSAALGMGPRAGYGAQGRRGSPDHHGSLSTEPSHPAGAAPDPLHQGTLGGSAGGPSLLKNGLPEGILPHPSPS